MISRAIKQFLIKLAIFEGSLALEGNELKGGERIEKYLAPFRELFIKHNPLYLNTEQSKAFSGAVLMFIIF